MVTVCFKSYLGKFTKPSRAPMSFIQGASMYVGSYQVRVATAKGI